MKKNSEKKIRNLNLLETKTDKRASALPITTEGIVMKE
jgi:hypothetical protein